MIVSIIISSIQFLFRTAYSGIGFLYVNQDCYYQQFASPKMKPSTSQLYADLSKQEEQMFKSHKSSLDIEKYKKGKFSFMKFAQEFNAAGDFQKYTEQYVKTNYLNKILFISSIKYYRDIRLLLIDQLSQPQSREQSARQFNLVIKRLENIAEGKNVSPLLKKDKQIQTSGQTQLNFSTAEKPLLTNQHTYSSTGGKSKLKLMNISFRQKNKELLKRKLKQDKTIQVGSRGQQTNSNEQIQNSDLHEQENEKITNFEKIHPSEYKFLKLFSAMPSQGSKNNTLTISTDRTFNHPIATSLNSDRSPRLITNLQENKLYHKHHHSPTRKVNRSGGFEIKRITKLPRKYKKSQRICNKIWSCIRTLLQRFQQSKSKQKDDEEDYLMHATRDREGSRKIEKSKSSTHP